MMDCSNRRREWDRNLWGFGGAALAATQGIAGGLYAGGAATYANQADSFLKTNCTTSEFNSSITICNGPIPDAPDLTGLMVGHYAVMAVALGFNILACVSIYFHCCPSDSQPNAVRVDSGNAETAQIKEPEVVETSPLLPARVEGGEE